MERPDRSLLVCANQRTGSTLLCRALADTKVAGRPEEYFLTVDPVIYPEMGCWEDGPFGRPGMSRTEYLSSVYRHGTTDNGVFGVKLMWNCVDLVVNAFQQVDGFAGLDRLGVFRQAFPSPRAVVLRREDRLAQAVSWARADQENVWLVAAGESNPSASGSLVYDGEHIAGLLALIERFERFWPAFLDELEVPYVRLTYEDIVADLRDAVGRVSDHLDVEIDDGVLASIRPSTAQQADEINTAWIRRFLEESAGSGT